MIGVRKRLIFNETKNGEKGNISIIVDADGNRIVVLNDLRFKGRKTVNWDTVETCLMEYIGSCTEILDTSDLIYIGSDFPDEYAHSKDTKVLRGTNKYAKANTSTAITDLIQVATNKSFSKNYEKKHSKDAKFGWYRYDTRFALPRYGNDILRAKKETSKPLE